MAQITKSSIHIDADPGTVLDVIAELEVYPEWAKDIKHVKVLVEDEGWADQAEFRLDAGVIKDTYVLDYVWDVEEDGTGVVSWTLMRASMLSVMDGSYTLTHDGEGTNVQYHLTVDTKVPMLGAVKRMAERGIVDSALKNLKRRVEG